MDILSVPRLVFMFVLFHVFICDFNRDACICFWSPVFGIFFYFTTLKTKLRPVLSLAMPRKDGAERGSCPVDI